jgi:hypothetical protein
MTARMTGQAKVFRYEAPSAVWLAVEGDPASGG